MTEPIFVDTNVLVYRHDSSDPAKQGRADEWLKALVESRRARLSFQVLQELYATLTRKLEPAFDPAEAQQIVRDLAVWQPVTVDLGIIESAWMLQERSRLSWWDALIVAAAQSCGCVAILTEDLQDGQSLGPVRVVNPFSNMRHTVESLLRGLDG